MGAQAFREALAEVLDPLSRRESRSDDDVARAAELIGAGNARRVYNLPLSDGHAAGLAPAS